MRIGRKKLLGISASLLAMAVAGLFVLDRTGVVDLLPGSDIAPEPGENAAAAFAGGPPQILFMSGSSLVRRDIDNQEEHVLKELPTANVHAAPGSEHLAYVTSGATDDTSGDTIADPVLHLTVAGGEEDHVVGPGYAPLWSPTGARLAYLKPVGEKDCAGEICTGESEVVVLDPESREETTVLDRGDWRILAWAGEWILVSDARDTSTALSVSVDGEVKDLGIPPSEVWDASPDGRWLVRVPSEPEAQAEFLPLDAGSVNGTAIEIPLDGAVMTAGTWAPDSSRVAAVLQRGSMELDPGSGRGGEGGRKTQGGPGRPDPSTVPVTEVVVFSPEEPDLVTVEQSSAASSQVLWTPDGAAVAFPRLIDPRTGLLQASLCPVDKKGSCSVLMSWTQSVVLLRME